jgi:putative membrane protein
MFKKALVVIFFLCWVLLAINPVDEGIWALENFLVVTVFPLVLWLDKRYNFNKLTYLSLTIFVILHLFGAHMTYNTMTYFTWFSDWFGWERNYYDQVIHFLFGLMVFVVFFEIFYHQGVSRRLSYLIAFLFITAIGAWYEVLEWLTMVLFCQQTDRSCFEVITQGDIWDAQKDIAYAMIGSIIALLLHSLWGSKTSKKK